MYRSQSFLHCCRGRICSAFVAAMVGLWLSGCATKPIGENGIYEESIPVDAMTKPLCLVPQAGPQACPMVVTYEIRGHDGEMYSIHFQTYENSIPKIQAHGKSPSGRPLNFDGIANYTLQLLRKNERKTATRDS